MELGLMAVVLVLVVVLLAVVVLLGVVSAEVVSAEEASPAVALSTARERHGRTGGGEWMTASQTSGWQAGRQVSEASSADLPSPSTTPTLPTSCPGKHTIEYIFDHFKSPILLNFQYLQSFDTFKVP